MTILSLVYIVLIIAGLTFCAGFLKARTLKVKLTLHSLPVHYGMYAAIKVLLPALLLLLLWQIGANYLIEHLLMQDLPVNLQQLEQSLFLNEIYLAAADLNNTNFEYILVLAKKYLIYKEQSARFLTIIIASWLIISPWVSFYKINAQQTARIYLESFIKYTLLACASVAVLTTLGILFSIIFEAFNFFNLESFSDFFISTKWSPTATPAQFGIIPLFLGTLLIAAIALIVAVPLGLMAAIYLAQYASSRVRNFVKPMLELLAGIPTVVYGFFAALTLAPWLRELGDTIGIKVAAESALAAGLVMGMMIIPFISSLTDDVISAVPLRLKEGSLSLGATKSETIKRVLLPAALPGIIGGILLAASRAIGETMIVVMAAGLAANLTVNPLDAVTTVTVQIVTLLTGDQEFTSAKTLAAFALALMLFITTLGLNIFALKIVKKYREQYD